VVDKAKIPKGDTAWLGGLISSPSQTHCFVNGIAFEATIEEVKKMFKKCGEIVGFHMPSPKAEGKGRYGHVLSRTAHCGKAVIMFRTVYGLRAALALNNTVLHGRQLVVSKSRRTLQESNRVQTKREQKRRKVLEAADAKAQVMPSDLDNREPLDKEQLEAKAWTEKVQKQINLKLAQDAARAVGNSTKKRKRAENIHPAPVLEPQDEFALALLAFKKSRANIISKTTGGPIGPNPAPATTDGSLT